MCYAVRVVVVASTPQRRHELRRAAVSAEWEVVADTATLADAAAKAKALRARFVVVDESASGDAGDLTRELAATTPRVFVVGVGAVAGTDANIGGDDLGALRTAMADMLHRSGDHAH